MGPFSKLKLLRQRAACSINLKINKNIFLLWGSYDESENPKFWTEMPKTTERILIRHTVFIKGAMKYPDAGYDDVTPPARSFSTSKKKDSKKGCTQIATVSILMYLVVEITTDIKQPQHYRDILNEQLKINSCSTYYIKQGYNS